MMLAEKQLGLAAAAINWLTSVTFAASSQDFKRTHTPTHTLARTLPHTHLHAHSPTHSPAHTLFHIHSHIHSHTKQTGSLNNRWNRCAHTDRSNPSKLQRKEAEEEAEAEQQVDNETTCLVQKHLFAKSRCIFNANTQSLRPRKYAIKAE